MHDAPGPSTSQEDALRKLPPIAARLAVSPLKGAPPQGTMTFRLLDGREYDIFELLGALLDRIEHVERMISGYEQPDLFRRLEIFNPLQQRGGPHGHDHR